MPLRDWGLGLEELTDYYHRYGLRFTDKGINPETQTWILMRGVIDQVAPFTIKKNSKKPHKGWTPRELDFVGLRIDYNCELKEVRLIQCRETVNIGHVQEILNSMDYVPYLTGIIENAKKKEILSKCISFVKITSTAKEECEKNGIMLISFKDMVKKLLLHLEVMEELKRKGFMREPIPWFLRSLKDSGFLKTN